MLIFNGTRVLGWAASRLRLAGSADAGKQCRMQIYITYKTVTVLFKYRSFSLEGAVTVTSHQRISNPSFWAKHPTRLWVQVTCPKSEVGVYDVSRHHCESQSGTRRCVPKRRPPWTASYSCTAFTSLQQSALLGGRVNSYREKLRRVVCPRGVAVASRPIWQVDLAWCRRFSSGPDNNRELFAR